MKNLLFTLIAVFGFSALTQAQIITDQKEKLEIRNKEPRSIVKLDKKKSVDRNKMFKKDKKLKKKYLKNKKKRGHHMRKGDNGKHLGHYKNNKHRRTLKSTENKK